MSFLNPSNDKRQQHADEYSLNKTTSTSLQVKAIKIPLPSSSITSTQTTNTNHNSLVSNTIQQCIHVIEINDRNQSPIENNGNYDNNYNNISTISLKSNDKVNLNHVYCYSINDNNQEKFILTTRKIIYTYSCGHKKSMTLKYAPIYSINHNQSYKSNTKFKSTSSFRCLSYKTILSADEKGEMENKCKEKAKDIYHQPCGSNPNSSPTSETTIPTSNPIICKDRTAVSYTHLTLPTRNCV